MKIKLLIFAIVAGVIITLITGLRDSTPPVLVGASWYGYPLSWLYRLLLAPQYFPWRVDALSLSADIIFWTVIVGIVLYILSKVKRRQE